MRFGANSHVICATLCNQKSRNSLFFGGLPLLSYHAYKLIHLIGLSLLLLSMGAQLVRSDSSSWGKYLKVSHGIGLLLLFVAGFGLIARLGIEWPWPIWIHLKLLSWVTLGVLPTLIKRRLASDKVFWWLVLGVVAIAAYLATFKPFV